MHKEIHYKLEKLVTESQILPECFLNTKAFVSDPTPYIRDCLFAFESYIATRERDEKMMEFIPPRQSFWDYILGRKPKPFKVLVKAKDVLKNPPPTSHNVIAIYDFEPQLVNIHNTTKPN